uniref:Uncharacterized protein n=1 Tax=Candidatus Kentrum sp. FM TaxID=2126340 RepID=A0A450VP04_9GAMM|nr:MAG: hypothetical protein BECKFM1743A_GA0114220_1001617 [Candidatus Kentron sp. FM]VFJ61851.1 MAG: hypothetical protein BECKFM1743C_GA0114222_103015 [Candidatus Kentron sp. FM]VFK06515.1 MAG: hypothetical protein BECKFM1743B_GA0114221_1001818 [Candidatus Kentron sp. FM]
MSDFEIKLNQCPIRSFLVFLHVIPVYDVTTKTQRHEEDTPVRDPMSLFVPLWFTSSKLKRSVAVFRARSLSDLIPYPESLRQDDRKNATGFP